MPTYICISHESFAIQNTVNDFHTDDTGNQAWTTFCSLCWPL